MKFVPFIGSKNRFSFDLKAPFMSLFGFIAWLYHRGLKGIRRPLPIPSQFKYEATKLDLGYDPNFLTCGPTSHSPCQFVIRKVHSHLVLGTLVLSPFNTILITQDLNLLIVKILCSTNIHLTLSYRPFNIECHLGWHLDFHSTWI